MNAVCLPKFIEKEIPQDRNEVDSGFRFMR